MPITPKSVCSMVCVLASGVYLDLEKHCQVDEATKLISRYNDFVRRVEELDLVSAVDAKPILDVSL
jgi:hypothetical protein